MNRAPYALCESCPLFTQHTGRVDPLVFGRGPERTSLVIVGEAPGETEVLTHKPFSGRSGKLLEKVLGEVDIRRDGCYITNAVLCHPNGNETPTQSSIKACQARLFEEVRQRQPQVIVAMGASALKAFGVDRKITKCRGLEQWLTAEDFDRILKKGRLKRDQPNIYFDGVWEHDGVYILPTYHPAYVLRNPDAYVDLLHDFQHAVELLHAEPAQYRSLPAIQITVPQTEQEALDCIQVLQQQSVLACDIESTGLNVLTGELLTIAYAYRQEKEIHAIVIPAQLAQTPNVRHRLNNLHCCSICGTGCVMAGHIPRCVWWNGKFDRKWYQHHLGIAVRIDGDGMLCHFALDSRKGIHGLKERAGNDLGADDYEAEIKQYIGKGKDTNFANIPLEKLVGYTAQDVGMTLMLTEQYEAELVKDNESERVYRATLLPAAEVLSDIELAGVAVDTSVLAGLESEFQAVLREYQTILHSSSGCEVSPNSYAQLVQVLYGEGVRKQYPSACAATADGLPTLGLPLILNKEGTPNTGSDACDKLLQLALTDEQEQFVRALRNYKLDSQLYRTYIKKLPEVTDSDGRIRTNYNLHVTRSGRLSSSDPTNLQNLPTRRSEGRRIKGAFVAGHYLGRPCQLLEVDLSQAELRVAAFLSREPALLDVYRQGRDFHHEVAVRLLGDEQLARELRPYIKTFIFAMLYGADPIMLVILLNDTAVEQEVLTGKEQKRWDYNEVQSLYNAFWMQFPTFAGWAEQIQIRAVVEGVATSYFGRHRRFPLVTKGYGSNVRDICKESVNHCIQSTAADILTLGMIEAHRWLQETQYGRIVATVHDSMLVEVVCGHEQTVGRKLQEILKQIPIRYGMDVPFESDVKIGPNWAELKKIVEV